FSTLGCGGGSSSYTSKAIAEYRAGNGYDWQEKKGKRPSSKDVAALEKQAKNYPAGSKKDAIQAFRLLSNQRDHDEAHFMTFTTSSFLRSSFRRVFGDPDSLNTKETPNTWTYNCTDGQVRFRGYWKNKGEPELVTILPLTPKN